MSGQKDHSTGTSETAETDQIHHTEAQQRTRGGEHSDDGSLAGTGGDESCRPMRRRSLLASMAGAALAGAGGATIGGTITPASAADDEDSGGTSSSTEITVGFEVAITNPRVVQAVENTRAVDDRGATEVADPDLVAGNSGAVLFGLESIDEVDLSEMGELFLGTYPYTITTIYSNGDERTHEGNIPGFLIHEMLVEDEYDLAKAAADLNGTVEDGGEIVPTFEIEEGLDRITIEFAPDHDVMKAQPVTIGGDGEDAPGMPPIHDELEPLRLGFIGVRNPDTDSPDFVRTAREGSMEDIAEKAVEYLEDTVPAPSVEAVVSDQPIVSNGSVTGAGGIPKEAQVEDAKEAKQSFPSQDLDHVILLVGFEYLADNRAGGTPLLEAAASIVRIDEYADFEPTRTIAHELGHYFLTTPYSGSPLAAQGEPYHAAPGSAGENVVMVDGYSYDSGFTPKLGSFSTMSRLSDDAIREFASDKRRISGEKWPDSLVYQKLIDGRFDPEPFPNQDEARSVSQRDLREFASESSQWFAGVVSTDPEDGLQISGRVRQDVQAAPPETESSSGSETDETMQFVVRGLDGDVYSGTVPTTVTMVASGGGDHQGSAGAETVSGVAPFTLPFPDDATEVEITYRGTTTTVQPLAVNLETIARKLPSAAFEKETRLAALSTAGQEIEAGREALVSAAQRMGAALDADAYTAAAEILDGEIEPIVGNLNADYPGAANVPDYDELQAMVDTTSERVQTLTEELKGSELTAEDVEDVTGSRSGGGSISTDRTSLHDKGGGPC